MTADVVALPADPPPLRAPSGLGKVGRALWRKIADAVLLSEREAAVLEQACRQADLNALMQAQLDADGLMVKGSTGQLRLHPAATELRQGRLAVSRMLADIDVPPAGDDVEPVGSSTPASVRGRKAADARWRHQRQASAARAQLKGGPGGA